MTNRKLSHDILNLLEQLRIMHDLVAEKKYELISKEELTTDLKSALKSLEEKFQELLQ
jgi:hypothetical protein